MMQYNDNQKLIINLSKEKYDLQKLLENPALKFLRIENISEDIELPLELNNIKSLEKLYFSGNDKSDRVYNPPRNLEKLINIKELSLWSYCNFDKLSIMPNVEFLATVIQDTFEDTKKIVKAFPNLKSLEIWGSHLKKGELPAEIEKLKDLEKLELISCGLTDLPKEFKNLSSLKCLKMRGLTIRKFPEVIAEMDWLEELHFNQQIISLPKRFAKMKSLKILNFYGAFNSGTMDPVDKYSNKEIMLHPIPAEIGKLPNLEELNLSNCGVVNIDFLKNSKKLKKFTSNWSGLENCKGFLAFPLLEELDLKYSGVLSDVSDIMKLEHLHTLNIHHCDDIENFDAVFEHPKLKVLEVDDEIKEKWQMKEKYINLPDLEVVIENIKSKNMDTFVKSVENLSLHVEKNRTNDDNPIAEFFGQKQGDEEVVNLPALENGLAKHKSDVGVETLLTLVKISLHSVVYDNYQITISAVEEIIKRKDAEAQKEVVKIFKNACEYYDFGHRYWGNTVLDQLYDIWFPKFETSALILLLENPHSDMLNSEGGDGADALFVPGFKNAKNDEEFNALLNIYFEYYEESVEYYGIEYFNTLQEQIFKTISDEKQKQFSEKVNINSEKNELLRLIESNQKKDKLELIAKLEDIDEEYLNDLDYKIINSITNCKNIREEEKIKAINFFIEKEKISSYVANFLEQIILPKGAEKIVAFLSSKTNVNFDYIEEVYTAVIKLMNRKNASWNDILTICNFAENKTQNEKVYAKQIPDLIDFVIKKQEDKIFTDNGLFKLSEALRRLDRNEEYKFGDITYNLFSLANSPYENRHNIMKEVCQLIFPFFKESQIITLLHLPIVSSIITRDEKYFDKLLASVPEAVTDKLLAFNLACGFAVFNRKTELLKYVETSLELGKFSEEFENDNDFINFKNDEEFKQLLNKYRHAK